MSKLANHSRERLAMSCAFHAILLTGDVAFTSKFAAAGNRTGVATTTVMSTAALLGKLATGEAMLILIDLTMSGLDVAAVVKDARAASPSAKIIAYGPHVHEAKLAAAQAAGCDAVLTRGAFNAQMDELLRQFG